MLQEAVELGEFCANWQGEPVPWAGCTDIKLVISMKAGLATACLMNAAYNIFPHLPGREALEEFYRKKGIDFDLDRIMSQIKKENPRDK